MRMRGDDQQPEAMFSYISLETRIPPDHPLRALRPMVDAVLADLAPVQRDLRHDGPAGHSAGEAAACPVAADPLHNTERAAANGAARLQLALPLVRRAAHGRPRLGRHGVRKNRERLLAGDVAQAFLARVVAEARAHHLLSNEHFTVDGTLIEAWAGLKSFKKKDAPVPPPDDPGNPTVNFHGERRSNLTHASTTDPDARLARKGNHREAKLSYQGYALMDNRHGLAVAARVTQASGTAEREAALEMAAVTQRGRRITLGGDKGYDARAFVETLQQLGITPHIAQNAPNGRSSAIDGRTTRHPGYLISQRKRKLIEEIFGWLKTVGLMRKTRHRGTARVGWLFVFAIAVYDLIRIRNLTEATA